MTNFQFITLLTPGLGSVVLVILAWIQANRRLDDLRADTHRQFDGVNRKFETSDRQFEAVNRRLDALSEQLATRASAEQVSTLAADFRNFYGMEQKLEGRVDELSKRIA